MNVALAHMDVEDLTQEVFLRAFSPSARRQWRGGSFRNYLAVIARNVVLDHLRSRQYKAAQSTVVTDRPEADLPPDARTNGGADSPERATVEKEAERTVAEFRESLQGLEARMFELRFVEQQSQQQVARALSLRRGRVRGLEDRVRRRFVRFLRNRGLAPC